VEDINAHDISDFHYHGGALYKTTEKPTINNNKQATNNKQQTTNTNESGANANKKNLFA